MFFLALRISVKCQLNEVSTHNSKAQIFKNNGREVTLIVSFYNLDMVKAIRGRNESDAADRFLAWADMLVKGIRNKIVSFGGNNLAIDVLVSPDENTVWLTQDQISELFGTTRANITMHIQNVFGSNELTRNSICKDFLLTGADGKNYVTSVYNLGLILSVGYRINSKRGIEFRKWANSVLKDRLIEGYAANEKRLEAFHRVIAPIGVE